MTAVGLLVTLLAGVFVVAAYAAVGHLGRIADAIEKQNEHYGIGRPQPTIVNFDEKDAA